MVVGRRRGEAKSGGGGLLLARCRRCGDDRRRPATIARVCGCSHDDQSATTKNTAIYYRSVRRAHHLLEYYEETLCPRTLVLVRRLRLLRSERCTSSGSTFTAHAAEEELGGTACRCFRATHPRLVTLMALFS